jgi:hypothetical protein
MMRGECGMQSPDRMTLPLRTSINTKSDGLSDRSHGTGELTVRRSEEDRMLWPGAQNKRDAQSIEYGYKSPARDAHDGFRSLGRRQLLSIFHRC